MDRAILTTKRKKRIRFPISVKLMLISAVLLLLSLPAIIALASSLTNTRGEARERTRTVNVWTALAIEHELESIRSGALSLLRKIDEETKAEPAETGTDTVDMRFFTLNPAIKAVFIPDVFISPEIEQTQRQPVQAAFEDSGTADAPDIRRAAEPHAAGPRLFVNNRAVEREQVLIWSENQKETFSRTLAGETFIRNAASFFDIPLLVMIFPYKTGGGITPAAAFFSPETISKSFATSGSFTGRSFMINEAGGILVQPDESFTDMEKHLPLIRQALESGSRSFTSIYTDGEGIEYFAAIENIHQSGEGHGNNPSVITISAAPRLAVPDIEKSAAVLMCLIGAGVLVLGPLLMWLYSKTISKPLLALIHAAESVEKGDYAVKLTNQNKDEIGELTQRFISMIHALEYVEKFADKTVLRLARQGKLAHAKKIAAATICIVKFRAFEKLTRDLSARDTAALANAFFSCVTRCIACTHGITDKFLTHGGIAVLAFWGALESASPDQDAMNCIHAALMMRASLQKLNQDRLFREQAAQSEPLRPEETMRADPVPFIKMNCAIDTGELLTGTINLDKHKEWLGTGEMVRLTGCIADANEDFDTDILIMENTRELIGDRLIMEETPVIKVQGRETPLRTFALVNVQSNEEADTILQEMEVLPDMGIARLWLGVAGPQTMAGVRERWKISV
ncbi:MAG: HAMP domain-containing protein [Treponema sp.]|jgi:adenylate cyclase|nr:HAMP domain-containing protein [Treponema sp.]